MKVTEKQHKKWQEESKRRDEELKMFMSDIKKVFEKHQISIVSDSDCDGTTYHFRFESSEAKRNQDEKDWSRINYVKSVIDFFYEFKLIN